MLLVLVVAALAVTPGSATAPSCSVCDLPRPSDNNFLYDFLLAAGYQKACLTTVLDYCDPTKEGNSCLSFLQVRVVTPFPC